MPDGRDAIGSRLEGNVIDREFIPTDRPNTDNPEVVSGTYVLDMFVSNADRHKDQWIVTEAGGGLLLRPIDFSRAWFKRWPLTLPPFGVGAAMPPNENDNSAGYYRMAKHHGVVASSEALRSLETLYYLPKDTWRGIIASVPIGWLEPQQRIDLINWWSSPHWRTRISWIKEQL